MKKYSVAMEVRCLYTKNILSLIGYKYLLFYTHVCVLVIYILCSPSQLGKLTKLWHSIITKCSLFHHFVQKKPIRLVNDITNITSHWVPLPHRHAVADLSVLLFFFLLNGYTIFRNIIKLWREI